LIIAPRIFLDLFKACLPVPAGHFLYGSISPFPSSPRSRSPSWSGGIRCCDGIFRSFTFSHFTGAVRAFGLCFTRKFLPCTVIFVFLLIEKGSLMGHAVGILIPMSNQTVTIALLGVLFFSRSSIRQAAPRGNSFLDVLSSICSCTLMSKENRFASGSQIHGVERRYDALRSPSFFFASRACGVFKKIGKTLLGALAVFSVALPFSELPSISESLFLRDIVLSFSARWARENSALAYKRRSKHSGAASPPRYGLSDSFVPCCLVLPDKKNFSPWSRGTISCNWHCGHPLFARLEHPHFFQLAPWVEGWSQSSVMAPGTLKDQHTFSQWRCIGTGVTQRSGQPS